MRDKQGKIWQKGHRASMPFMGHTTLRAPPRVHQFRSLPNLVAQESLQSESPACCTLWGETEFSHRPESAHHTWYVADASVMLISHL